MCLDLCSMIPRSDKFIVDQQVKCMSDVGVHVARDRSDCPCSNAAMIMQPACTMRACKPSATYTTALPASRSRWVTPSATSPQHVDKLCQRCRRAQRVCAISRTHRSPQRSSAIKSASARTCEACVETGAGEAPERESSSCPCLSVAHGFRELLVALERAR
jgi:hypothetical protein